MLLCPSAWLRTRERLGAFEILAGSLIVSLVTDPDAAVRFRSPIESAQFSTGTNVCHWQCVSLSLCVAQLQCCSIRSKDDKGPVAPVTHVMCKFDRGWILRRSSEWELVFAHQQQGNHIVCERSSPDSGRGWRSTLALVAPSDCAGSGLVAEHAEPF